MDGSSAAMGITRTLHFIGVIMVFLSLGAGVVAAMGGSLKEHPGRKLIMMTHGIGMLLLIVAGIGLTHVSGYGGSWPGFVYAKVVIWLGLGGVIAPIMRKPELAKTLWWVVLALGAAAVYLAAAKPF